MNTNIVIHWDCLEVMKSIPNGSIDAIITDTPYWTTACKWDSVIPFEPMWKELKRIIKPNGAIVLFGSEPFSSALRMSNIKDYKYDWIWEKSRPVWFLQANKQPMRNYENIMVFYKDFPLYNPQWVIECNKQVNRTTQWENYRPAKSNNYTQTKTNYPRQVLKISSEWKTVHPTQKPVALIEYLIRTYTNEWETVLDFTAWSGTTWVACQNTNRKYILIEKDEWYYEISKERLLKNKILLW